MFGRVEQAHEMGAAAIGATIYFGSAESNRQIVEVAEAFEKAHELGMATILWCYLRNENFKSDEDYHVAADLTGQANHLGVTLQADIIKQKQPENNGGYDALTFGKTSPLVYSQLTSDHPIDLCRYQVANCYMGRAGLINSGGASGGSNDLAQAIRTAVINKRARRYGLDQWTQGVSAAAGRRSQVTERHSRRVSGASDHHCLKDATRCFLPERHLHSGRLTVSTDECRGPARLPNGVEKMTNIKIDSTHPEIVTVQQHLLSEQRKRSPDATGAFSWLLSGITLATKMTESKVRRAGLLDVTGAVGDVNVQGEMQQKLDVYADNALVHCLGVRENVAIIASEENEEAITFDGREGSGRYVVLFDPLDGSSNIDVNVSVGTIFSILKLPESLSPTDDPEVAVRQAGTEQLAAGYVVYGSSTILVYTTGHGVHGFTLDPTVGAYVLSHEHIRMPEQGTLYSSNDGYWNSFPQRYRDYITHLRSGEMGRSYSLRYIGSLVADFHRTLLKGGIFLYPPTAENPDGKLRLLYEANPVAFIAEQAGGMATDGERRILEIEPQGIHQRTPLIIGSQAEMRQFESMALA